MNKPHKHAEIIKAWADGAEIQWRDIFDGKWFDVESPTWKEDIEYRIKPEPAPDVVKKYNVTLKNGVVFLDANNQFYCQTNLILFFDGVSGHLRNAEVI